MSKFGTPPFSRDPLAYIDSRLSGVPTVDSPRDPTINDTNYPIQTIWRNNQTFRECILVGFIGGDAQWVCFTDGDGTMLDFITDDGNVVSPLLGNITVAGFTVANGTNSKPLFSNGSVANQLGIDLQVGAAITGAPADSNDAGIVSFDDTSFAVDANGYVTLLGGSGPAVDTNAGDDLVNVSPNGSGEFFWIGTTVANATNVKPLYIIDSATPNALEAQVQVGAAITGAPADSNDAGIVSFDDTSFSVDANGYVTLVSGDTNAQVFNADTGSATPVNNEIDIISTDTNGIETSAAGNEVLISMESPFADSDFTFEGDTAGIPRLLRVYHPDVTNPLSSAVFEAETPPASGGDPFTRYVVTSTGSWCSGIDSSDDEKFKIRYSTLDTITPSSGASSFDRLIIDTSGNVVKENNACASVDLSAVLSNVTGDGTLYGPVIFDTEFFDQNSNYDPVTGLFTAPVNGRYLVKSSLSLADITASHTVGQIRIVGGGLIYANKFNPAALRDANDELTVEICHIINLAATDTAGIFLQISNGTKVVDISPNLFTSFSRASFQLIN